MFGQMAQNPQLLSMLLQQANGNGAQPFMQPGNMAPQLPNNMGQRGAMGQMPQMPSAFGPNGQMNGQNGAPAEGGGMFGNMASSPFMQMLGQMRSGQSQMPNQQQQGGLWNIPGAQGNPDVQAAQKAMPWQFQQNQEAGSMPPWLSRLFGV